MIFWCLNFLLFSPLLPYTHDIREEEVTNSLLHSSYNVEQYEGWEYGTQRVASVFLDGPKDSEGESRDAVENVKKLSTSS